MSEYQDLGHYIMKLFDSLITDSKNQINEKKDNFIRELPRKLSSRTTVSAMMVEGLIREISDQLLKINQDCLNNYSMIRDCCFLNRVIRKLNLYQHHFLSGCLKTQKKYQNCF